MTTVSTSTPAYNLATLVVQRRDGDSNKRIERDEWKGAPEQFDRFDRNDDGGVSIEEIRARLATLPADEQAGLEASLQVSGHKSAAAGAAGLGLVGALATAFPAGMGAMSGLLPLLALGVSVVGMGAWVYLTIRNWGVGGADAKLAAAFEKLTGQA